MGEFGLIGLGGALLVVLTPMTTARAMRSLLKMREDASVKDVGEALATAMRPRWRPWRRRNETPPLEEQHDAGG